MNEQILTSVRKRTIALLLCFCLCFSMLPTYALAAEPADAGVRVPQGEQPEILYTPEGEIPVEEDWNEAYPYGTFAFGNHQADVGEPGSRTKDGDKLPQTILIPVYRLGGTVGRVTALVTYAPAVTTQADGSGSLYDYAASGRQDLLIEYENPNPIAAYQALGVPAAERAMTASPAEILVPEAPEGAKNEDKLELTLSEIPESCRWQVKQHGVWQDIRDADEPELRLSWGDLWNFEAGIWSGLDFRCILENDGVLSCTRSLMGEAFEPMAETPPMPEDLDTERDPGYSELVFDEDYAVYRFELTFADGETVKYIRVTARDDELAELPELGLFTIAACEGGQLSDTCNTLTLMVSDNDRGEPSELGFTAERVTAYRADNSARVKVARTGGKSYNVTVHYETVDGTAKAGVDYARKEGDLAFAGSIDEIEIPVELIATEDSSEKSFDLVLTELRGGGEEALCKLVSERVTVTITGKSPEKMPDGSGLNLASLLANSGGEDVSARIRQGEDALLADGREAAVTGVSDLPEPTELRAALNIPEPNRMHVVYPNFSFTRNSLQELDDQENPITYDELNYWQDWEIALGGRLTDDAKSCVNYRANLLSVMTGQASNHDGGDIRVTDEEDTESDLSFNQFVRISADYNSKAELSIGKAGCLFDSQVFVTRLDEVGFKERLGKDAYLRPEVGFHLYSNGNDDSAVTDYCTDHNRENHYYYWYTDQIVNTQTGELLPAVSFGADIGQDSWPGKSHVHEWPLKWNSTAYLEVLLEMYDTWGTSGGCSEACGTGRTEVDILTWSFHRREFEKTGYDEADPVNHPGIPIVVYTANDENEAGGYAPIPGALYANMVPEITLVADAGGVSPSDNLYVGSKLKIKMDNEKLAGFCVPENGVFMTNQRGERVGKVTADSREAGVFYVEMLWNGMKESSLTDTYQLNIILERAQTIRIDINPSTPRNPDGSINTDKYGETWNAFLKLDDAPESRPVLQYAPLRVTDHYPTPVIENGLPDYFDTPVNLTLDTVFTDDETGSICGDSDGNGVYVAEKNWKNIQSVNFNQDAEDVILYNGRAYAGNETILITAEDMNQESMTFIFYDSAYLDAISTMDVFIDRVELYYDTNGNKAIDGRMVDNVFVLDKLKDGSGETADEYVATLEGDYPDSLFQPYKDKENNVHQYYFKVFLTMRPRALTAPAGADENASAQLLPAFLSAVTDPEAAAELTDEQLSYRYIRGKNTDNHPMYGKDATRLTYIDIPLGGDVGEKSMYSETVYTWDDGTVIKPPEGTEAFDADYTWNEDMTKVVDSENVTVYSWTPEYTGQLLVPFENPTPIVDNDNITGGSVAIAGENPEMNEDGSFELSKEGKDRINASLGSFSGRTTFAIGVQEQLKPTESTRSEAGIDSLDDIKPEAMAEGTVGSTPGADDLLNMQSGGDPGSTSGTGPGEDAGAAEFAPDLGTKLPSLELELGDYVTIVMDGYEVGFAIGIPVYQYEDTSYSGSEQTQNNSDGSTTTTRKDDNGNTIRENTKTDNGTTTKTTTTTPPYPDGGGFINQTTTTTVTDKDGKTKTETTTTTYYKKNWQDEKEPRVKCYTETHSELPPTEQSSGEKAREGFKNANGGMATLKEFCKALTSPKKGSMKKFFDGAFEDEGLDNAKNGNCTSTKVEVTFKIQISIMFEYNPIDNCHYFKTAGLAGTLGVEFTVQHRFSFCPLVYVYLKVGIEVELKVSISVLRVAKEGEEIDTFEDDGSLEDLSEGKTVIFSLDMRDKPVDPESGLPNGSKTARGFHLDLKGKVYMEVYGVKDGEIKKLTSGMLSGDGGQKEVLFEPYDQIVSVHLTPKKNSEVTASNLKPVIGAVSKTVFDGLTVTPGLSLEAGAGVGVEFMKFEIFIRTSVAISMTMGGYLEDTESYEGFYISSFEWTLALGFHLTIAFFNYSMDCIGIGVEGAQHGTGGYFNWDITASAVDGNVTLWEKTTYTAADGKSLPAEPEPPTGFNFFKDNPDCTFYNLDGSVIDLSENPETAQDWYFSENVSAHRWAGGKFKGEIPMNADLAVAFNQGSKLRFTTDEDEIWIYFSGVIQVASPDLSETKTYKKSPAKLSFSNSSNPHTVDVAANAFTKLDRFETPPKKDEKAAGDAVLHANAKAQSLVHVSGPTDVSGTQNVIRAGSDTRAINPTGTSDFQLSGYNTSGDARLLVEGLAVGYDYKLIQVGKENYVLYPLMLEGAPQLVLSRLVVTGNYDENSGLEHPLGETGGDPYLVLDDDGYTDLDYNAAALEDGLRVLWVSYADKNGTNYTVRSRTISFATGAELSEPVSVDDSEDGAEAYRYLAVAAGDVDLWVTASGSGENNNQLLKAWLLAKNEGLTEEDLNNLVAADPNSAAAVYTWAMLSAMNDLYGQDSILCFADSREAATEDQTLQTVIENQALENLEAIQLGGQTLLLYSTAQTAYFNDSGDGFVTVGAGHLDEITAETERGVIRRLYLQTLDEEGFGNAKLLQTVIDFEGCTEDNLDSAALKDGVYENSALRTAQADPYFSNLRFLRAKLDENGVQTVALFEMGGNTWLLPQADLEAILDGDTATLIPVFSESTGTDVCIGSDGDNLAVIYTTPIADSLSNAIFVAWWDQSERSWGVPTILAMRDLQIYEDRITYGMSGEDAEKAYLGQLKTESNYIASSDPPMRLSFSNLQMSTRSLSKNEGDGQQLIILTQGSLTELMEQSFTQADGTDSFTTYVPQGDAEVKFYAIAFGAGQQALGEARLGLSEYDFTTGSRLIGQVEFTNTGTAAVRATDEKPMTVQLMARLPDSKGSQTLAVWNLTTPIVAGARTKLSFHALPLTANLPLGTVLYLDVAENQSYYGENSFHEILDGLLTVGAKPELSITGFDMAFQKTRKLGDEVYADYQLSLTVPNNGTAKAEGLFLQFSYDTGEQDDFGNAIYRPVDISVNSLLTSGQQSLETRDYPSEEQNGIYRMVDDSGSDELDAEYYRTVTGSLSIPASCFVNRENFSGLHLRVEVYSAADEADIRYGAYSSEHNEYNSANNWVEQTFKHQTTFELPARINTALGTTLNLPVRYASTGANPELILTEISDGTDAWEPRMGVCYYDSARGVIVAAPNARAQALLEAGQKPTGLLQLKDQSTNTIATIAYTVSAMADGVNIYKDDASFRFYDKDGNLVDVNDAAASEPAWVFLSSSAELGWTGGDPGEIPMDNNLSIANQDGAYLCFDTVADTITLYFMGDVQVSSSVFEVEAEPVYTDRASPVKYSFVKDGQGNETGRRHTVTVTAKQGTRIDRYVATYKTNPIPDADTEAPQILWSRSFPQTASLQTGESVSMTCYILDNSGLQTVSFEGKPLSESTTPQLVRVDENLWYFDHSFTENGTAAVRADDRSGNSSRGNVYVDWFNEVVSIGAISEAPGLTRAHLDFVDEAGVSVAGAAELTEAPYLISSYQLAENETSRASLHADGAAAELGKLGAERWLAGWNGCYQVRVDRDDGAWARALIPLRNLRLSEPDEKPNLDGDGDPASPFLIANREDWLEMKRWIEAGHSSVGKYFLQVADVEITDADMVGVVPQPAPAEPDGDAPRALNGLPMGRTELILGGRDSVTVKGWAIDPDEPETALTIQVLIGEEVYEFTADKSRPDVSGAWPGAGNNHGFEETVHTELTGKQTVTVLAVNRGEGCDVMLGTSSVVIGAENCFMGVYDGGGYTLTFQAEEAPANCAPFQYAKDATFRNLRIEGTIKTANKYAAGLCANAMGVIQVENCSSRIEIQSNRAGECTHGGFIAEAAAGSEVTVSGSSFDGKLLGRYTNMSSGFVGCTRGVLTIRNCVFAPVSVTWQNYQNFARLDEAELTLTNSYYVESPVNQQGAQGFAVLPREDIVLDFGAGRSFDTAEIVAYPTGLSFRGVFYAGEGERVTVKPAFTGDPEDAEPGFRASAGEFTENEDAWLLVMPAESVTITLADHVWGDDVRYDWDEETGTVTASVSCINNPAHVLLETVQAEFFLIRPSTTEREGAGYWKAVFAAPVFAEQRRDVVIPRVSCEGGETCPGSEFEDMPPFGHYSHIPIDWAVINHVTAGTSPVTFGTKERVTRAQFVSFLWVLNGKPEPGTTENPFTDVRASAYYYKAVLWAREQGITSGTTATTFSPHDPCSRAQVVAFLWAALGKPEPGITENPFTDVRPGAYYCKPVLWALENGVTAGTTATTFGPHDPCTRAQVMTFLYKVYGQDT